MEKIDLCKLHKEDYAAPKKPALVDIKPAQYMAVEGQGSPEDAEFGGKIGALYAMAFTVKMTRKFAGLEDYTICKLEAQWQGPGGAAFSGRLPKTQWQWKLLIRTPGFVAEADLAKACKTLCEKGKGQGVEQVHLETITEGQCVQMLHVGPYDRECETVDQMKAFAEKRGLALAGRHHEIYLSDPRRIAPERLKTILRSPVAAKTM